MKKSVLVFCIIFVFTTEGCNIASKTDKHYKSWGKTINVSNLIQDIPTNLPLGWSSLYLADSCLVVAEWFPRSDKAIHLLSKNTFKYITSTAIVGKGPGEVTRQGEHSYDAKNNVLWVQDLGKMTRWKFPLDSILSNPQFKPSEKIDLPQLFYVFRLDFMNDSIAFGKAVKKLGGNKFEMVPAKFNIKTNEVSQFGYQHPKAIGEKLSSQYFKFSPKDSIYACGHYRCDLMTICNADGSLRANIYGPEWMKNKDLKNIYYYANVEICFGKFIVAGYVGDVGVIMDKNMRYRGNLPKKILMFDFSGNHKATLDLGFEFTSFCVDEENSRIIVNFSGRENPLGYFELNVSELE